MTKYALFKGFVGYQWAVQTWDTDEYQVSSGVIDLLHYLLDKQKTDINRTVLMSFAGSVKQLLTEIANRNAQV